jgi:succinylglutamate desuccinylase
MTKNMSLHHVLVSGGTHGNEYTGAFLARHWLKEPAAICRTSFETHTLFANPEAFAICRRYVDRDLNRSFNPSGLTGSELALELNRARDIEVELRRKCGGGLPDVIFDLHTTTSHMGLSLVLTNREPFNILLYAYLRKRFPEVKAYLWEEPDSRPGFLNSLSKNGFAIEVGPVANGVLNAEWVFKTAALVSGCLDFIEKLNAGEEFEVSENVPLFCFKGHVDYPRGEDGLPSAMIHPRFQGSDFQLLQRGDPVFVDFSGNSIQWTADPVWPVFINEAAYYEKGIAFTVTERLEFSCRELWSLL